MTLRECFAVGGGVGAQAAAEESQRFHRFLEAEWLHPRLEFREDDRWAMGLPRLTRKPRFVFGGVAR